MARRRPQDSVQDHYAALHQGFGWQVPERFNIAEACCGRWAARADAGRRTAIREHRVGQGLGQAWSFAQLQQLANRLSQVLKAEGVQPEKPKACSLVTALRS